MYCSHFGLHRPPFNNTPDPSFYYSTPDHEEALATLQYATLNRKGFVLVSGEVGAGKTLIGRMFIRQVDRQASTAVITHTQLNARQLLAAICAEFELEVPADATNLQLADTLQEYLLDQFARDRFVVVLLDEAQNLPDESFEALRMLGNLEADDAKLLQVCILGQPELRDRFKSDSLRQLDQRLFRRFHLEALTQHQMTEYIERRLSVAGCPKADLFTAEALEKIYRGSQGIPRLINRVCDNALLAAYAQGREAVDAALISQVLEQEGLGDPAKPATPPAEPQDTETEAKIEQIYGTSPEVSEVLRSNEEMVALREVVSHNALQWPALRQSIETQRVELQKSVDEAADRCRHAEERIAAVAREAVPAEAIEELRRLHHDQTGRVLQEIATSRESVQQLVQQTEMQLGETESRLREMRSSTAGKEELTRLEQRQDRQLEETLALLEQHRNHIEHLLQLLANQCDRAQAGLATIVEAQSEWQSAVTAGLESTLAKEAIDRTRDVQSIRSAQQALRAEWAEQLDRGLGELDAKLHCRLADAVTTTEVDKIRMDQAAIRDELTRDFQAQLIEIQSRIGKELEAKASAEQLLSIQESQANDQHALRQDVQSEVSRVRGELQGKVAQAQSELQGAVLKTRSELQDEVAETQSKLRGEVAQTKAELRDEVAQAWNALKGEVTQGRSELQDRVVQTHNVLQEELVKTRSELEGEVSATRGALHGEVAQVRSELQDRVIQTHHAIKEELARTRSELESEVATTCGVLKDEAAQTRSELQDHVLRARDALKGDVENTRAELHGHVIQTKEVLQGDIAQTRTELEGTVSKTRSELERKVGRVREELSQRIGASTDGLSRLSDALDHLRSDHRADTDAHMQELADQSVAIADIYASVGRHEDEIRCLSHDAAARFDTLTRGLSELRNDPPGSRRYEQLRSDHESLARDVLARFEQKACDLDGLRQELEARLGQTDARQDAAVAELSARIDAESKQLRQLRRRLIETHAAISERLDAMDDRYAARSELEILRQAQTAQAGEVLERIQADRQAVEAMVDQLSERFRATHQRLDALGAAAESDGADLAELRRAQADDVACLLRQLEDQRRLSQDQFERSLAHWTASQSEISELRSVAADASALAELSDRQQRDSQTMLRMLDEQRQNFETLICGANDRCERMLARLEALPANVASTGDVQALHEEGRSNKAALESAIRSVADQCDHTASALRCLEVRAATVDNDLERIRHDHAQNLDVIVQRLDGQSSEYQQEFDTLKERWSSLRGELQSLAGSTTPVKKFEATERLITRDMNALKQRLDDVAGRRRKDLKILVDVVQRLSERVKQLEESDRPQPVRVELRPRAAEELAALNTSAEAASLRLQDLLAQTGTVGNELRESSVRVEHVMREWVEQAARVQEQSDQLRASAGASGGILQALRKCHDAIDNKLKSAAWHGQLRRGEELTSRLEQVLPKYQEFEETVHTWQQERAHAEALVQQMERLLVEAGRATGRLGRVGALMAGMAGKTNVSEAVESARQVDEQLRPTRGTPRRASEPEVQPVAWPKYRTHANAG